ncbi:21958_t:CDS:1, partial [Gigaspora rosea]
VIIVTEKYEMAEPLQEQLEKAINDVKNLPEKLAEVFEHQEVKEYLQEIDQQLKDFWMKKLQKLEILI